MMNNTGFTLVELLVAIAIIGVFTALGVSALSGGGQTKATALMSKMNEVATAITIFKKNTGCVPSSVSVLFDKTQAAVAANEFCGQPVTTGYGNQDYLSPMSVQATGVSLASLGLSNVVLYIRKNLSGTTPNNYAIEVDGLPSDVLMTAMSECNGIDYSGMPVTSLPSDFTNGSLCVYVTVTQGMGMLINRF